MGPRGSTIVLVLLIQMELSAQSPLTLPDRFPEIRGRIISISQNDSAVSTGRLLWSLLIKEGMFTAHVTVTKRTELYGWREKELQKISFDDLRPGQQASAWFFGVTKEAESEHSNLSFKWSTHLNCAPLLTINPSGALYIADGVNMATEKNSAH